MDGGVHQVALLRTILPDPAVAVTGFASLAQEHLVPHDTITAALKTKSGAHGVFEMSFGSPSTSRIEAKTTITGTDGFVEVTSEKRKTSDGEERQHWVVKSFIKDAAPVEELYLQSGVEKEIEYFVSAIRGSKDDIVLATGNPRATLLDVAVIQAGLMSNGSLVDLNALLSE